MAQAEERASQNALLTLEIWHPDCWTLEVTGAVSANLLAHTVYNAADGRVKGHFTAYGDSAEEIDRLVDEATNSRLTYSVVEMQHRYGFDHPHVASGNVTRELLVEYDPNNTVSNALASQGFIQEGPVKIRNGTEYWSVFVDSDDRDRLHERLEAVQEMRDAEITVTKISSHNLSGDDALGRVENLSKRQREIFELACEHDYYTWPRGITTCELADKADISKTTLLEHLRKAEVKLLDPAIDEVTESL
ncbi:helix-turn-helix domain-containing protein [Haloterrigena salifodinae]|uniref:Helix-turn-helix domain-containing protein n=1 Tax=Haloterrigena salifodinae TaxID=2675099 RepID=A0A8T8DX37_9EURY|nr:helix-turn-helix domain-containing protein [Haloterrigena salifodinae]QRV13927.1 helix-turn-helix domain-containing protein [Haloterrigena salifodinae]